MLSDVTNAESVPTSQKSNISAFYTTQEGKQYSIGSVSTNPYFRGRKLVLEYVGGSPCPAPDGDADDDDKEEKEKRKGKTGKNKKEESGYRKSTIMSHLCDHDAIRPAISFVGQVNHCGYFFEVRSSAACPTVGTQALGPISVFGIMYPQTIPSICLLAALTDTQQRTGSGTGIPRWRLHVPKNSNAC